jgi:carnitine-CoA ligase
VARFEREPGQIEQTTWAEAAARAWAAASVLHREGVGPGDRFHVHLTNTPEFYDSWFAASMTGSVMAPTNPLLTAAEFST